MTNGEKIRQMSDEELALFLGKFEKAECLHCIYLVECNESVACECGHLGWLKSEAAK